MSIVMAKFLLIPSLCLLLSCSTSRHWTGHESMIDDAVFSQAQAERILGVPVGEPEVGQVDGCIVYDMYWRFHERGPRVSGRLRGFISAYVTLADDSINVEQWYRSTDHIGLTERNPVTGVGDEAYLLKLSNDIILEARKGKYMISFHLRPSSPTSAEELVRVAREVVAKL